MLSKLRPEYVIDKIIIASIGHSPSDNTSYASEISLKRLVASSMLSGFLSGCHFNANLRYLKIRIYAFNFINKYKILDLKNVKYEEAETIFTTY